jgi:hypothetical protein
LQAREPVDRPLDVITAEVLLTLSQALLVGILLWLAQGFWEERAILGGPILGVLVVLAVAVGSGWLLWLLGQPGWPMAAANLPVALLMGAAFLLGIQGYDTGRLGWLVTVPGLVFSITGIVCGVFLPGPRRVRWQGMPPTRAGATTPRVSPTLTNAIERTRALAPSLSLPRSSARAAPTTSSGLSVAPDVPSTKIETSATRTGAAPAATSPAPDNAATADTAREEVAVGGRSSTEAEPLDADDETQPWPRPTSRL